MHYKYVKQPVMNATQKIMFDKEDVFDKDKVQETTAARNPMKKNKAVYVTCNQTFAIKNGQKTYPGRPD